jgi:hypothetical protein
MVFGAVQNLCYRDVDFSELSPQLRLEPDRLIATLGGARLRARMQDLMPFRLDGQLQGKFADGGTFHGDMVLSVSHRCHATPTSVEEGFTIQFGAWTVLHAEAPSLWVGCVEGATRINFGGNLIVERVKAGGYCLGWRGHFCFLGAYSYYLIQSKVDGNTVWHLLVDTGGVGVPDHEVLEREFLLLQFVLGRQLRIPMLLGITADGGTVASTTGTGTRRNLSQQRVAPVPIDRNNDAWVDESWATVFFERVGKAWASRPDWHAAYLTAFDSYLDATTLHLDADYLRLQVALEAFSYSVLRLTNQEERMVVKDKAAWKTWVRGNADAIRALASEGFENTLLQKVIGVYRLSSGRVVPSAFVAYETALLPEMSAELEERNVVVHQGCMAPDGYDVDRELRRIAMIRTMLVALIAKSVGYAGAINGWEVGHLGYLREPETWWTVHEDDRRLAQRTFVAEAVEDELTKDSANRNLLS